MIHSTKQPLLQERELTKTAIKIKNYTVSPDQKTLHINDMTSITAPNSSEYNFQFQDTLSGSTAATLRLDNAIDMELIDILAKVTSKTDPQHVEASKLK